MSYCRYCGTEISYKRTKNEKWMPCNFYTGEPHFCNEDKKVKNNTGIIPCKICGKPTFVKKENKKNILYDYSTLEVHVCKKGDITRFKEYKLRT